MRRELKSHYSFQQQLDKLVENGLLLNDESEGIKYLEKRNYFRLSGYWFPLRKLLRERTVYGVNSREIRESHLIPGHNFNEVIELYDWDSKLRSILLNGLAAIEVALRSQVSYYLGALNPGAHMDPSCFNAKFSQRSKLSLQIRTLFRKGRLHRSGFKQWQLGVRKAIERERNTDDAIAHQLSEYGQVHVWTLMEILDFLQVITAYKYLKYQEKDAVTKFFGFKNYGDLYSSLMALNNLRNKVAHHNRTWNRNFSRAPKLPSHLLKSQFKGVPRTGRDAYRLYPLLAVISYIMNQLEEIWWVEELKTHLTNFPKIKGLSLTSAGFPNNWKESNLWLIHKR